MKSDDLHCFTSNALFSFKRNRTLNQLFSGCFVSNDVMPTKKLHELIVR
jgi:hypothetical protein